MSKIFARKKNPEISFESLEEMHFPLIHKWFNSPHIQAYYSLRDWTIEEIRQKLTPYIKGVGEMKCYIVSVKRNPIGYVQSYPVKFHPWENQDLANDVIQESAGIDLFIGEKELVGKGLGCDVLDAFLEHHIWPYYRYCLADPNIYNEASMRLFKKCGFREHTRIKTQDALKQPAILQLFIKERNEEFRGSKI